MALVVKCYLNAVLLLKKHSLYCSKCLKKNLFVLTLGEDEESEIFSLRARLYRYAHECDPPEWKERLYTIL